MADPLDSNTFAQQLQLITDHLTQRYHKLPDLPTLPLPSQVKSTIQSLPKALPSSGLGTTQTIQYLLQTLLPGCLQAQNGPKYFGFVVGGITPAAQLAEILLTGYDENVQVTLPGITAATAIEARTLEMVLDLIDIPREKFLGRTITTGATASNVLGMACARDYLYSKIQGVSSDYSYARDGPPGGVGVDVTYPAVVILGLHPHYSILKAAALVGLGNGPKVVHSMPPDVDDELAFDLEKLELKMKKEKQEKRGVIVTYGLGEVNTGGFGRNLKKVATLCRQYGAWLHIDAAFGGFAGIVPEMRHLIEGMEEADSLTLDGHKWLNVPYDCGLFYTKSSQTLPSILGPTTGDKPAYLTASSNSQNPVDLPGEDDNGNKDMIIHEDVPSPLYVNIENSRRFRALPLFASLMSLGKEGYIDIVRRNCTFAQNIAKYIHSSPKYDLLNYNPGWKPSTDENNTKPIIPLNIVLFAPSGSTKYTSNNAGADLAAAINATRKIYVTGTKWRGRSAVRLAVSNWMTGSGGDEEVEVVRKVLEEVML